MSLMKPLTLISAVRRVPPLHLVRESEPSPITIRFPPPRLATLASAKEVAADSHLPDLLLPCQLPAGNHRVSRFPRPMARQRQAATIRRPILRPLLFLMPVR